MAGLLTTSAKGLEPCGSAHGNNALFCQSYLGSEHLRIPLRERVNNCPATLKLSSVDFSLCTKLNEFIAHFVPKAEHLRISQDGQCHVERCWDPRCKFKTCKGARKLRHCKAHAVVFPLQSVLQPKFLEQIHHIGVCSEENMQAGLNPVTVWILPSTNLMKRCELLAKSLSTTYDWSVGQLRTSNAGLNLKMVGVATYLASQHAACFVNGDLVSCIAQILGASQS